jgi:hypothetical protein
MVYEGVAYDPPATDFSGYMSHLKDAVELALEEYADIDVSVNVTLGS